MSKLALIIIVLSTMILGGSDQGWAQAAETVLKSRAEEYFQRSMFDEAVVAYKEYLAKSPEDLSAQLAYARTLKMNTLEQRAIEQYRKVLAQQPENSFILMELADIYRSRGEVDAEIALYQDRLREDHRNAEIRFLLANALLSQSRARSAIGEFKKVLAQDKNHAQAMIKLGDCFFELKKYGESELWFLKAKSLLRDDPRIAYGLAKNYERIGRYDIAAENLEAVLEFFPEDENAYALYAQILLRQERETEAAAAMARIIKINPQNYHYRIKAAGLALERGEYAETLRLLDENPSDRLLYYERGLLVALAYAGQGNFSAFWRTLTSVKIAVFAAVFIAGLFFSVFAFALGAIFLAVHILGRNYRRVSGSEVLNQRYSEMSESYVLCLGLFFLPLLIGIIVGGVFFQNWLLIFLAAGTMPGKATNIALISQALALCVICGLIFSSVLKKQQGWGRIGFSGTGIMRSLRLALLAIGGIMIFDLIYFAGFYYLNGHNPETQVIGKLIDNTLTRSSLDPWQILPLFIFVVFLGPAAEEIIFRGLVFSSMRRSSGFVVSAIASSIIFGLFHFQAAIFLPIAFMGIMFSWICERAKSIYPAIIAHVAWNMISFVSVTFFR